MACWLILAAALMPTVVRAMAAADPWRAAAWSELCSAAASADREGTAGQAPQDAADDPASAHCPLCTTPGLAWRWPAPDGRADFAAAPHRLRPVSEPLGSPRPAPVWRLEPPRAPPALD
ncbi:DUF2946 family protein [Sphaerotilus hippei]|uniref:DUF2946 family protein n=1 Tax=Sphaerotilus hippei TaxID=744406 RepID=UPI001472F409|nr:DUF2946 family protein [Sphaerotilus hippei]